MKYNNVYGIYFSPTGNTKKCVQTICKHLSISYADIDLTEWDTRHKTHKFTSNDIVIIGVPVYAGRISSLHDGLLEQLQGDQTPAIFVVTYGNRDYEDALLELKTTCEAHGFIGIAAAAYIGQHSFLAAIAANRPDEEDMASLKDFATSVSDKLRALSHPRRDLNVKGNTPYRELPLLPFTPSADDNCVNCQRCVAVCPVQAITRGDVKTCEADTCIRCLACVKTCPQNARSVISPVFSNIKTMLQKIGERRRQPEVFL